MRIVESVFEIYNAIQKLSKNLFTNEYYEIYKEKTVCLIDILKDIEDNKGIEDNNKYYKTIVKKLYNKLQEYDSDICLSLIQEVMFLKATLQFTMISTPELKDISYKAVDVLNDFINILNLLIAIKANNEKLLPIFLQNADLSNLINILEKIKILPDLFDEYFKYIKYDA